MFMSLYSFMGKVTDKIILLVLERTSESSIRGWRGGLVS